eukprot:scaffold332_cov105-Isochrysis_galbana.AAC.6
MAQAHPDLGRCLRDSGGAPPDAARAPAVAHGSGEAQPHHAGGSCSPGPRADVAAVPRAIAGPRHGP